MSSAPALPRHTEYSGSGAFGRAEVREYFDRAHGAGRLSVGHPAGGDWAVGVVRVDDDGCSSSAITLSAEVDLTVTAREDEVMITSVAGGPVGVEHGRATARYGPGDVFVATCPQADWTCETGNAANSTTVLPESLLRELAGEVDRPWRPSARGPEPGQVRQWQRTARFVNDLLSDRETTVSPLVATSVARLLAATALAVFADTAPSAPTTGESRDAHPATVRRAIAFIEADPGRDLTLTEIAAAAFVTARALQYAFHRHLGITPMAYLRRVRLSGAHQELRDATPGDGVTVTAVATRWGFANAGRFAVTYRDAYGHAPSSTLRR
ncbi:helix-turn-helix domain-containing protein [Saccharothrix syringae]|uniref:AraC family transcriptional regulator n=1 Tax=Saccharothrix syringae TaxID=103733 RepID=A0A5Q0H1E7_SACSY|nr:helix-turn-helix domain-containing protein [Saccharothrix syringae]QFZ19600.1 AraC family transcriptional regulator [Saccharothrix syringae]